MTKNAQRVLIQWVDYMEVTFEDLYEAIEKTFDDMVDKLTVIADKNYAEMQDDISLVKDNVITKLRVENTHLSEQVKTYEHYDKSIIKSKSTSTEIDSGYGTSENIYMGRYVKHLK